MVIFSQLLRWTGCLYNEVNATGIIKDIPSEQRCREECIYCSYYLYDPNNFTCLLFEEEDSFGAKCDKIIVPEYSRYYPYSPPLDCLENMYMPY